MSPTVFLLSPANLSGGIFRRRFESSRELYQQSNFQTDTDGASTEVAQPAIVMASLAGLKLLNDFGISANIGVGHSLGEITAACVAEVMTLDDAIRLITARGALMHRLPSGGAMAALFAEESVVRSLAVATRARNRRSRPPPLNRAPATVKISPFASRR